MVEVISTFNGKSGPSRLRLVEPLAGVIVTASVASVEPPLFLQAGVTARANTAISNKTESLFMVIKIEYGFQKYRDNPKITTSVYLTKQFVQYLLFFLHLYIAGETFFQGNKGFRPFYALNFLQFIVQNKPQLVDVFTNNFSKHAVIAGSIV